MWLSSCSNVGSPLHLVILLWEHGWVYDDYDDSGLISFIFSLYHWTCVPFVFPWVQIQGSLSCESNHTKSIALVTFTKICYSDTAKHWYHKTMMYRNDKTTIWWHNETMIRMVSMHQRQDTLYIQKISSNLKLVTYKHVHQPNHLFSVHVNTTFRFINWNDIEKTKGVHANVVNDKSNNTMKQWNIKQ